MVYGLRLRSTIVKVPSLPDIVASPNAIAIALMNPAAHQARLLASAGRYLAGGGLGLFVLPPELNLVIARGEGSHVCDVAGREFSTIT